MQDFRILKMRLRTHTPKVEFRNCRYIAFDRILEVMGFGSLLDHSECRVGAHFRSVSFLSRITILESGALANAPVPLIVSLSIFPSINRLKSPGIPRTLGILGSKFLTKTFPAKTLSLSS